MGASERGHIQMLRAACDVASDSRSLTLGLSLFPRKLARDTFAVDSAHHVLDVRKSGQFPKPGSLAAVPDRLRPYTQHFFNTPERVRVIPCRGFCDTRQWAWAWVQNYYVHFLGRQRRLGHLRFTVLQTKSATPDHWAPFTTFHHSDMFWDGLSPSDNFYRRQIVITIPPQSGRGRSRARFLTV